MRDNLFSYLARVAPEKGLHELCEAYRVLRATPGVGRSRLVAAGYLPPEHQAAADEVVKVFGHIRGPFSMLLHSPKLAERLLPLRSLAARFAAKEAAQKAIGTDVGTRWIDFVVLQDAAGTPRLELRGTAAERAAAIGAQHLHVSMSHDAGIATATVIAES